MGYPARKLLECCKEATAVALAPHLSHALRSFPPAFGGAA
jgi:hypothetical protein